MFEKNGKFSASINQYTAKTLRSIADEAESAYEQARQGLGVDDKVQAGFVVLNPIHPDKTRDWDLPKGTQQLSVVSAADLEERKAWKRSNTQGL